MSNQEIMGCLFCHWNVWFVLRRCILFFQWCCWRGVACHHGGMLFFCHWLSSCNARICVPRSPRFSITRFFVIVGSCLFCHYALPLQYCPCSIETHCSIMENPPLQLPRPVVRSRNWLMNAVSALSACVLFLYEWWWTWTTVSSKLHKSCTNTVQIREGRLKMRATLRRHTRP